MFKRIFILILVMITLSSCTNPIKSDLSTYINVELPKLYNLENEVITLYEDTKNKNNFSEVLINDIIPKYELLTSDIKSISLKTEEIRNVHDLYIKASELQLNAFKLLHEGIKEKNNEKVNEANSYLKEAKDYMDSYKEELLKSVKKYKIDYKLN